MANKHKKKKKNNNENKGLPLEAKKAIISYLETKRKWRESEEYDK